MQTERRHLIIDSLGHEREVAAEEYQAKRKDAVEATVRAMLGDGLNDREHFRRVFTSGWDFSQFAR